MLVINKFWNWKVDVKFVLSVKKNLTLIEKFLFIYVFMSLLFLRGFSIYSRILSILNVLTDLSYDYSFNKSALWNIDLKKCAHVRSKQFYSNICLKWQSHKNFYYFWKNFNQPSRRLKRQPILNNMFKAVILKYLPF